MSYHVRLERDRPAPGRRAKEPSVAVLACLAVSCATLQPSVPAVIESRAVAISFEAARPGDLLGAGTLERKDAAAHRETVGKVSLFNLSFLIGTATLERAGYEAWRVARLPTLRPTVTVPISFLSTKASGAPDRQSGLVALPEPKEGAPVSWVVFLKGTELVRDSTPSARNCDEMPFIETLASMGYAVWAPDYTGMGEAEGFHEYCVPDSLAASALHGLAAARAWTSGASVDGKPAWEESGRLYVTGYSEGGLAAMATLKALVEGSCAGLPLPPTGLAIGAAYPMAAPFNLASWIPYRGREPLPLSRPEYQTCLALGWAAAYPERIRAEDVLSPRAMSLAVPLFDGARSGPELRAALQAAFGRKEGEVTDADLFSESFLRAVSTDPRSSPYVRAQLEARLDEWIVPPGFPVVFAATPTDQVVRFFNTERAFTATREGSPTSDARLVELSSALHAPAGAEAFLWALRDIDLREETFLR